MADSKVTLEVILEGKNLKVVQKDLDKVTSSTNKASAASQRLAGRSDNYNKGQKGVAQATANSTKAFSKMRNEIGGGSSGLVAAYATLAANLFAATAAFNALRSASKVEELVKGLEEVGISSGRNLGLLADRLREVTNSAISTEEALRAAAVATSASFSDDQLLRLTNVAKGASLALGRDLGDALDRLVRGTAKLEPEILDELGIFVRLDDATESYARTLNKTSEDLTEFERRQAFLNMAIEKGEERFAGLAKSLDTNPYDKLGAAFQDLAKNIVTAINGSLVPAVEFLSTNLSALGGVSLIAGAGVARNIVGSFAEGAQSAAEFGKELSEQNKDLLDNLETTDRLPDAYKKVRDNIKDGTASLSDYKTAFKSLDKSIETHERHLDSMKDKTKTFSFTQEEKTQRLNDVKKTLGNLRKELMVSTAATANFTKAQALSAIQSGQFLVGVKLAVQSIREYSVGLWTATKGAGALATANAALKISFFAVGTAVQVALAGLLSVISAIGIIIALGPQIKSFIEKNFFPEVLIKRRMDEIVDSLSIVEKTSKRFAENFYKDQVNAAGAAKAASGLLQETINAVTEAAEVDSKKRVDLEEQIAAQKEKVIEQEEKLKKAQKSVFLAGNPVTYAAGVKKATAELNRLEQALADADTENAIVAGQAALDRFYSSIKESGQLNLLPEDTISNLDDALADLEEGKTTEALETFLGILASAKEPFDKITTGFESLNGAVSDFKDAQTDLLKKTATPYDTVLEKAKNVKNEIEGITNEQEALNGVLKSGTLQADILEKLKEAGFENTDQLKTYVTILEKGIKKYIELPVQIKKAELIQKNLNKFAKEDVEILKQAQAQQIKVNQLKLDQLANEEDLIKANRREGEEGQAQAARLLEIGQERLIIQEDQKSTLDDTQEVRVLELELQQKNLNLANKATQELNSQKKAKIEIRNIDREISRLESGAGEFSAQARLGIFLKEKTERLEILKSEFDMKTKGINLEYDLLEAKFELLKAQAEANKITLSNTQEIESLFTQGRANALANAETQYKLAVKRVALEEAQLSRAEEDARTAFSVSLQGEGGPASILKAIQEARANYDQTIKNLPGVGTLRADNSIVTEQDNDSAKARARLQEVQGIMAPFIQQLESLGPEGMLVSSVAQGALVMADAFQTLGEKGLASAEGLAAVGAVLGAVSQIQQASSQANIAAIDQQIKAEQKRDGKSKESLAKIKALEQQKEKEKKKAFEMNKKMLMAQTIANTAAGVMATMKDGVIFTPLAMLVAAMGAAQLAIIAGTSYQGGGSSASSSVPSTPTVEVGKRKSSVDLATSQGGAGELAYFRGAKGIGGPEDFTPAFMGAKYRNEGGPTAGYTVGEQGPELFVPSVPGTIVPNDEMQQTPQNVNISINAIDSQGVEQVLVEQRGNIIGMIRDAANNVGTDFYEEIDTAVYTPSSAGARLY